MLRTRLRLLALPIALFALASCQADAPTVVSPSAPSFTHNSGPTLLECPTDVTRSTSATIGFLGGTLTLGDHQVVIPSGAVLVDTEFSLVEPASNYMEVHVHAKGFQSFQFEKPVSLTVSYNRCTRTNIEKHNLRIFHTDEATKAILEDMGGTDDKTARKVTTNTDHLSGFTVGAN